MKSVLLIGVGRFGRHMAKKLVELHNEVMAVDIDEQRINQVLDVVTNAQIGDCTREEFVASLGVRNFDICVVAIGDDFEASLISTALLKENGAKFVLARASQDAQAKFLLHNGADKVVYPEKQVAQWSAVRYSSDNIFDFIELTPTHSLYEINIPVSWIGKTIRELKVRQEHNLNIVAIRQDNDLLPAPGPDYEFASGDIILVVGANKDIQKILQ